MPAEVLFTDFTASGGSESLGRRLPMMLTRFGFRDRLKEGARVAVKVHPGERNNITYIRPSLVRPVVEWVKRAGAEPFVTESTTLYCRERYTQEELIHTAAWNGFTAETLGCPFTVADSGPDVNVRVQGRYLEQVGIASEVAHADALIVLSHVTAHGWTAGLAASIKQLGMGCVGRSTKREAHLSTTITISEQFCNACAKCARACKGEAIRLLEDHAVLTDRCVRCGVCIAHCPQGAIQYLHDFERFARALAEAASGVLLRFSVGRAAFLNFLTDITWHCDCEDFSDNPVFPNLGVLASMDPVAVDQASADMLNGAEPIRGGRADRPEIASSEDRLLALTGIEWWRQLECAEELGLGRRRYNLRKIRP